MSTHRGNRTQLCFIDVETTGARFGFHEVIDIGAVRTSPDGLEVIDRWSTRVLPQFPERITKQAAQLNGFDEVAWISASGSTPSLWLDFARFASGCRPVCHNPSFDRAFIMLAAESVGVMDFGLDHHWIGTESLAWPLVWHGMVNEFSLEGISAQLLGYSEPLPHTALGGAEMCRAVYLRLIELFDRATELWGKGVMTHSRPTGGSRSAQ